MIRNIPGTDLAVIPMACHTNMRGLNQLLYQQTGHVNKISFANGISHGSQFSFLEQVRNQDTDCILIVGTDPYSSLPASLVKNLDGGISLITLDPYITPTSLHSTVVFGTAISGIESGGREVRMDGTEVTLTPIKEPDRPSDEDIIARLLERV
jgi:formylmethanofuran dehydrogenase subunit B